MTWIRTIPIAEADERLKAALEAQRRLYPQEYAMPVAAANPGEAPGEALGDAAGIVASHTLIPDALYHAFSTFGVLMSADLPLSRRQHEMITTMVSVTNRCFY
jgi:hypothetical protein